MDHETAQVMGININRTISFTFGLGSLLAAVGGIMWGMKFPHIATADGGRSRLEMLYCGGDWRIGNIGGAVIGGFILGIGEIMLVAFLPTSPVTVMVLPLFC